eukprot:TRINITY_DN27594_c0_g1_i1.p1 TRINITY_DN27594_c0_g1~~TRINITY_DN27594_c0_g1_i1.p1  ORF type:complete len:340 (-),score=51.47 TRINITY_DN27594_c0_g1_i1:157-1176(-)
MDPAVTYYSSTNDASIRIESRKSSDPEEVYFELREKQMGDGWKIGMNDDHDLHIGWGTVGTANGAADAIKLTTTGGLEFYGAVEFRKEITQSYVSTSGLVCTAGQTVIGEPNGWSGYSSCPSGYSVVGLQGVYLHNSQDSARTKFQDIDHLECNANGCRAWCRADKCDVTARCCKTDHASLRCEDGEYQHQSKNQWGTPAYCGAGYVATGFASLDLHNNVYWKHQMINDFYCTDSYCQSWCWGSNCGVKPRCCKPRNYGQKLECVAGSQAYGDKDKWGPYSVCGVGYTAISHQRIDMLDHVHADEEIMHKYECNEQGCRAWCWGSACHTWAKCCRITVV